MALSPCRWKRFADSRFPHEREALEFLRDNLPDSDPIFLYSNFEFVADDGSVNEVDALVLTRAGLFLVEIKGRGGKITGNRHTWSWEKEGNTVTLDSPLILANSKAKKLGDLLGKQKAFRNIQRPFVEALVFCSAPGIEIHMAESERMRICLRNPLDRAPGILPALLRRESVGIAKLAGTVINTPIARAVVQAIEQAGIQHSQRERRVGDYVLGGLIEDNALLACQDFEAWHPTTKSLRRVRLYNVVARDTHERERLKQAALREYSILDGLDHPGIVKAVEFREHELGPAIFFRREADEIRLDHYLAQEGHRLTIDQRLDLVRQLAEALKYAHGRRIIHRALMPRSILVTGASGGNPQLKIFNWQLGRAIASGTTGTTQRNTIHPNQIAEGSQLVYVAPEALLDPRARGETMDVFSVGAIAYLIFSDKVPAATLPDRDQILMERQGLVLTAVLDGVDPELGSLIHESTRPEVIVRTESIAEFLKGLDAYEEKLTAPEREHTVHPLQAKRGDLIQGGLEVDRRLGGGSAAVAFLVKKGDKELVLKVSRRPEDNERIRAEHHTLTLLRHPRIVAPQSEELDIEGLAAFLMERAGTETLGERLQRDGRLSLDLLQRFGEDLLDALLYLEEEGIAHRDLKPENIGIGKCGKNNELRLKLFDFSLSNAPLDQIRAGTPPYLEPFLPLKERGQRWDTAAERFAATIILHEMATGTLPYWGDRQSAPYLVKAEASVESELIDAPVRESLTQFFQKALRRDPRERFDNAVEMLGAWHNAFALAAATESSQPDQDTLHTALAHAELGTSLHELPLSTRARNVLDRLGAFTVQALLQQPPATFFNMRGVGSKTRREILDVVARLRQSFPESAVPAFLPLALPNEALDATDHDGKPLSIDEIVRQLLPTERYEKDRPHRQRVISFLELEDNRSDGPKWPSQTDIARQFDKTRALIGQDISRARQRWRKTPCVTEIRREISEFLAAQGGCATADELSQFLLSVHASETDDLMLRLRRAAAAVRAALEAERAADKPRWEESRGHGLFLIAMNNREQPAAEMFPYCWELADTAKQLAEDDPLPSPSRVLEMLRGVQQYHVAVSDNRLLRLAAATGRVSLSPRLELYPTGMPAKRALKLAQASLAGLNQIRVEEIQQRVRDRYPEALALPGRPELDSYLLEVGLNLKWSDAEQLYVAPRQDLPASSTFLQRAVTVPPAARAFAPVHDLPRDLQQARDFERRLQSFYKSASYLVLFTAAKYVRQAESELRQRFPMETINLDAELISEMKATAAEFGADWNVVLRADATSPESQDRRRLLQLFERALHKVERRVRERSRPVLLTFPGLLVRYGQISMLERLSDELMQHGLWVLIAGDRQTGRPTLDGVPVPARGPNQTAEVPPAWIENRHRSTSGGAQ